MLAASLPPIMSADNIELVVVEAGELLESLPVVAEVVGAREHAACYDYSPQVCAEEGSRLCGRAGTVVPLRAHPFASSTAPIRARPFASSTNPGVQVMDRCNVDVQCVDVLPVRDLALTRNAVGWSLSRGQWFMAS